MFKIVGNLKMNKTNTEIKNYIVKLLPKVDRDNVEVVLCPPYTALSMSKYLLEGSKIELGAQNISDEEEGKNTGEISGMMLKDCGVHYVIVGHSERRAKFKENGKNINKKIKVALKNGLSVILCVGESLTDKNCKKTIEVVKAQLEEALKGIYENELENIAIAYEPVWAIGTGKTPLPKEIDSIIKFLRKIIANYFSEKAGEKIGILYGGSIDNKNCVQLSKIKNLNGFLIGGACLDADNLSQIIRDVKF